MSRKAKEKAAANKRFNFDPMHAEKVCEIPLTTVEGPKPDPFDSMKPEPGQYYDYNISQTTAIMDRGPIKIRYRHTEAVYEDFPADYVETENRSDVG